MAGGEEDIMANEMTVTTLANSLPVIKGQVYAAAENARIFRALGITEIPFAGPGSVYDAIKVGAVTAAAYTEANARTFSADTVAKVSFTPYEIDVAMSFTDKARRRNSFDVFAVYGEQVGKAVAVKMDADCAAEYANFTGTTVDETDTTASLAKLLAAAANVRAAAKDQLDFVRAAMHTSAWDDLLLDSSGAILSASVRGAAGSSAAVTGTYDLVAGVRIGFSTCIVSAGATAKYQNMVFSGRTIGMAWKSDLLVEMWDDRNNKAMNLAASADYDVACIYPTEGVVYTVTV